MPLANGLRAESPKSTEHSRLVSVEGRGCRRPVRKLGCPWVWGTDWTAVEVLGKSPAWRWLQSQVESGPQRGLMLPVGPVGAPEEGLVGASGMGPDCREVATGQLRLGGASEGPTNVPQGKASAQLCSPPRPRDAVGWEGLAGTRVPLLPPP